MKEKTCVFYNTDDKNFRLKLHEQYIGIILV